jgi:hypothetical protein
MSGTKKEEVSSEKNRRPNISITVSRYLANAKAMIESAGFGVFP